MDPVSVGPYRVIDRLGAGGMGEVFVAIDTRLDRKVALKYLSDPSLDLPRARERLLREARAAAHISHPNIAAIYDVLDTGPHPCIVMEYVAGETLSTVAGRGPLPAEQAAAIGAQLADALAHAHAAGVVHRDLKPANVVLTAEGAVKILDFGVARVLDIEEELAGADTPTREALLSQPGRFAGTPAYMAPEQLAGRTATPLTDVYSLGVTLFELLTSQRPFGGKTTPDLVYQMLSAPAPLPSALNGAVPPVLDAIVAKAMARDPSGRFRSASEMAAELRRIERVTAVGSDEKTPSFADIERRLARRRLWRRLGALAAGGGVLALAVWSFTTWRREAPPPLGPVAVAVLPFTSGQDDPAGLRFALGFSDSIAAALEGLSSVTVLSKPDLASYVMTGTRDRLKSAGELGVGAIIGGEATAEGSRRAFSLRVQRPDGRVVFQQTYTADRAGDAAPQRRAVADIVGALRVSLTAKDRERLRRVPACRDDAYPDYVEGRALLDRKDIPGNMVRAEEAFSRAVAADSRCVPAWLGLADAHWAVYEDRGPDASLVDRARQALDAADRLDPDSVSVKRAYATLYLGTGRPEQAEKVILDVIERRPFDDELHRMRAAILRAQGRTEEAMSALRQALRLRPDNATNYLAIGNAQLRDGRFTEAIDTYAGGLAVQPDNAWLKSNLAAAYDYSGQPRKAMTVYESVTDPDATMLSNLSVLYFNEGRYKDAAELLTRALALDPRSAIRHGNLGDTYRQLGRAKDARDEYRKAATLTAEQLRADDRNATVLARHAAFLAKLGESGPAIASVRRAVDLAPDDNAVLYKRAVVHALLRQRAEAVVWLRHALEKGYSVSQARSDPDLEAIRTNPEVAALLRKE